VTDPLADLLAHTAGTRRLRSSRSTPMGRAQLRDLRPADAPDVHRLLAEAVAEGLGFIATVAELGPDLEPTRRALLAIEAGDGLGVVASVAGRVVGYALARRPGPARLSHDAHLEMVLEGHYRGLGLGGFLLDGLIERARMAPGLRRLSLSVFADNEAAVRLYRSRGFDTEGCRKGAVQHDDGTLRDDLLMVLWVDAAS